MKFSRALCNILGHLISKYNVVIHVVIEGQLCEKFQPLSLLFSRGQCYRRPVVVLSRRGKVPVIVSTVNDKLAIEVDSVMFS